MFNNLIHRVSCALILTTMLAFSRAQADELTFVDEYLHPEFNKTISMDFLDAKLNLVLKVLSQQSGMNFVASDTVRDKTINVYLDNVKVWEALERILESNKLTYEMRPNSNVFTVKELVQEETKMITRVYELRHIPVPSHLINSMLTFDDEIGEQSSTTSSSSSGNQENQVTPTTKSEEEGIVAAINAVLSEDGSVIEDRRTNSLIVTDFPTKFPVIESTIARLDVRVPQILIEAEMLDISKNTVDLLGAKFGDTPISFHGAGKQGLFPFNEDNIYADNLGGKAPGERDSSYEEPRYTTSNVSFTGLSFILQFLRTSTDTKNLARPRILTLNNQTATIAIKTDETIGVVTEVSQEGAATGTVAERTETGVFLKVTPQANVYTREIMMALEPKVIQARASAFAGYRDPEERGTKSILRVLDGDTIIIGGLLRTDETGVRTSVPVVSKVPIIGAAFRHKEAIGIERELIVFLTPHIVEGHVKNQRIASTDNYQREQNMPSGARWNSINKDLSYIER